MSGDEGGPDLSCFSFADDSDDDGKAAAPPKPADPAVLKRHRQEEQQLRTEAKAKRNDIPKGDKKARAAAEAELEASLAAMRARHAAELTGDVAGATDALAAVSVSGSAAPAPKPLSKAEKRRQKQQEEERERERRIAEHHAGAGPSERDVEMGKLDAQLAPLGLGVHEIPADGHCLYRSLAHQLSAHGDATDFEQCRRDAANYIRAHAADFVPYLAADGVGTSAADVAAYCSVVEGSSEWGGQLEITAISHARKRAIQVFSADAPPLLTGEEYADAGPRLELAYHRHYFGLGEHYNAVVPK